MTLAAGEQDRSLDAGIIHSCHSAVGQRQALGNLVFFDTDGDGRRDSGEPGVGHVRSVTLAGAGDDGVLGTADDTSATTETNSTGQYAFNNLIPTDRDSK